MQGSRIKLITGALVILAITGCNNNNGSIPTQSSEVTAKEQPPSSPEPQAKYDGPFGLKMGLSVQAVKAITSGLSPNDTDPSIYTTSDVPVPHPDFESYTLGFSKKSGLCKVVGIGKDIVSGDTGSEVRIAFDSIDEALTNKYGKGKKYDFSSVEYDSPEFWMMNLLQKNRMLAKFWTKENGSTLSNNIDSISLEAKAADISTGYLVMQYDFDNVSDCEAESKAEKNKGL